MLTHEINCILLFVVPKYDIKLCMSGKISVEGHLYNQDLTHCK